MLRSPAPPPASTFARSLLTALSIGALSIGASSAQDAAEVAAVPELPELFFETVEVNVVNVEVIVTDPSGGPVRGLRREDFRVFEDGQPVEITNFFAVEGRETVVAAATPAAGGGEGGDASGEPAAISLDGLGPQTQGLVLVVFIDNLSLRPENRNRAIASLRSYLEEGIDPRDRVMVVSFDGGMQVAQTFTNDLAEINRTLDELERETGRFVDLDVQRQELLRQMERTPLASQTTAVGALGERGTFEAAELAAQHQAVSIRNFVESRRRNTRATIEALERFNASLAGLPGRKAILYVSDGLPIRPGEAMVEAWQNKYLQWASQNGSSDVISAGLSLSAAPVNMTRDFRDLVEKASEQGVAFYPLTDSGRLRAGQLSAQYAGANTTDGRGVHSREVNTIEQQSLVSSLQLMAEGTGGIAYTQSSNLAGLLDRMVVDFTTFYSIGYTPPDPDREGFREIRVEVARDGVVVRHLGGHRELDPVEHMENLTLSALYYGFETNPLDIRLATGQQNQTAGGDYRIPLLIKFPFERLALLPHEGSFAGRLKAYVVVRDASGNVSPIKHIVLPIEIPERQFEQAQAATGAYQVDLVMRPGKHRVSVGVRDELAKLEATVNLDVNVGLGGG